MMNSFFYQQQGTEAIRVLVEPIRTAIIGHPHYIWEIHATHTTYTSVLVLWAGIASTACMEDQFDLSLLSIIKPLIILITMHCLHNKN